MGIFNKNHCWDLDLAFGEIGEKNLYKIFKEGKVEVKRDRIALKTGNMAIEYEHRDIPSGIATSEADYWCYIFTDGDSDMAYVIIPTERLKALARRYFKRGDIKCCAEESKVILIPINEIFRL